VSVLAFAPAEDRNGFVVTGDLARRHHLVQVSDLAPMAASCHRRAARVPRAAAVPQGASRSSTGSGFARFESMPSRAVTAAALGTGEIDVGMIDTTDPSLLRPGVDLVQLADDRRLQPADNVVPVLRRELLVAYGPRLVNLLNAVSAQLTTVELTRLNLQVADGRPAADTAAGWLRAHTIIG
jgi:osmoprotectant transport system substrate-binding protein